MNFVSLDGFYEGPGGRHAAARTQLAAGLVDELHVIVGAVVLGGGTPAFATPPPAPLRLRDVRTFDGSDNVLVRYAAGARSGPPPA